MKAVSLFSSAGIGDLGLEVNGIHTVVANELLADRAKLFSNNYPDSKMFQGDIWELKDELIQYYFNHFDEAPFVILATPPCQGMSSNGMGKMLSDFRKGLRTEHDERNRLIIPAIEVITKLQPEWIVFENVPNMTNTLIHDMEENLVNIMDYIFENLGSDYVGKAEVINVANYGVPQNRKRLITIATRSEKGKKYFERVGSFLPKPEYSDKGDLFTQPWRTLRDAIENLPPLDGKKGKNKNKAFHELHYVPFLDEKKYFWVQNTPEGETAFNNQCINPDCLYNENQRHGTAVRNGINQSNKGTPLYCEKCGELLPRPYSIDKKTGNTRLMRGFTSAYKRMKWDEPASTITRNFQYVSSDNKIHPTQNRVLSIYEALKLQTIADYEYDYRVEGKMSTQSLIRDTIGESVPPLVIDKIAKYIKYIDEY